MKRIALAPLLLAAAALRWLNGKPDPRVAHRMIVAVVSVAALIAILSPAPAAADHGHNCVYSGGGWIGQGLCPGMPGFEWHGPEPTPEPTSTPTSTPTATTPAPTVTTPAPTQAPSPTTQPTTPTPTSSPTSTTAPTPTTAPTTSCVWSGGAFIGQGDPRDCPRPALPRATPSTSTTTPAPVVTGPLVETDIVLYAPEVNPARILR